MKDSYTTINEKVFACLELRSISTLIKTKYGEHPPADVLNELMQLAKAYREKYIGATDKTGDDSEFRNFCTKNGLPLMRESW